MSEQNIEVVREVIAAYSGTGEVRDDLIDPEIEIWESPELPGELAGHGHEALSRATQTVSDSFENWSIVPERFFDLEERELVYVTFRGTGKGSGLPADGQLAYLFGLRDGKVIEWGLFGDRAIARKAAGLED